MLGFGALGEFAIGEGPFRAPADVATLVLQGLIIPAGKNSEGILIKSTSAIWLEIAKLLATDWALAAQLSPTQWEEMVAGAYQKAGYQVVLTPRSGDLGRDVIATSSGVGSIKILGSVKKYAPGHLVTAEACRSLIGVVAADRYNDVRFCAHDQNRSIHRALFANASGIDERRRTEEVAERAKFAKNLDDHPSSSGCTHRYGTISRSLVSRIMLTGGE